MTLWETLAELAEAAVPWSVAEAEAPPEDKVCCVHPEHIVRRHCRQRDKLYITTLRDLDFDSLPCQLLDWISACYCLHLRHRNTDRLTTRWELT
jgi:hypothetical protein